MSFRHSYAWRDDATMGARLLPMCGAVESDAEFGRSFSEMLADPRCLACEAAVEASKVARDVEKMFEQPYLPTMPRRK